MLKRFDEFIDSLEIREYNKKHEFTPAEWAVLIGMSRRTSAEKKLEAWEWLLENCTKEEFGCERVEHEGEDFYELLKTEVKAWHEALELRKENDGYFFTLSECSAVFSSFDKAFEKLKAELCEDRNGGGSGFYATIYRRKVDNDKLFNGEQCYHFDKSGRMCSIYNNAAYKENDITFWAEDHFVDIPTPFKVGDIVRYGKDMDDYEYGVITHTLTDEQRERLRGSGDYSDMRLTMTFMFEECGRFGFEHYHPESLDLVRITLDKLPENKKLLEVVSMLVKGEMDWLTYLHSSWVDRPEYIMDAMKWVKKIRK